MPRAGHDLRAQLLLLEPFQLGALKLPNRLAFLATVNNLGSNDRITSRQVAFYRERARGGCGLIITEGLAVHPTSVPNETVPLAFDRSLVPGFRRLAKAVHDAGSPILGQLWHVGRQALWNPTLQPWAPSPGRDPFSGSTPHQMTETDIQEVIEGFALAAENLKEAGFDGVEIHGAHGYLITQFLSPWSNQRSDRWGGPVENRTRIVIETIGAIRKACGEDFVVGLKLSVHEYVDGGLDLAISQEIVRHVVATARPEYIAVSQANFSPSLERHVPDMRFPDVPFVELAQGVRDIADGVPVMALAKVPDVAAAERLLREGISDLVGMSRPLIADAHLVAKTRAGQAARPCIYCNVCWHLIQTHRPISCVYAPESGDEFGRRTSKRVSAGARRTVRIIGAGAAGLEVARIAALRGHRVHVYEALPTAGGRLTWEAGIAGRETVARAAQWLEAEARRAGALIQCTTRVGEEMIASWSVDDLVVVGIGAEPVVDPLPGAVEVLSLEDAVVNAGRLTSPVAIIDEIDDEPVYAAAETLRAAGHEVCIVTRRAQVGRNVPYVSLIGALRRLSSLAIRLHVLAVPVRVQDGKLIVRHPFSERERSIDECATIVRAGPYASRHLSASLRQETLIVGDASAPRPLVAIFKEANALASRI